MNESEEKKEANEFQQHLTTEEIYHCIGKDIWNYTERIEQRITDIKSRLLPLINQISKMYEALEELKDLSEKTYHHIVEVRLDRCSGDEEFDAKKAQEKWFNLKDRPY